MLKLSIVKYKKIGGMNHPSFLFAQRFIFAK